MRIQRLALHNFRFFADSDFSFPAQFTVLIGENGRGKSALLHGLRIAAGAWMLGFKETERLHIEPEDIRRVEEPTRFAPQFPAVVRATGVVEGQPVTWARQRNDFKGGLGRTGWAEAKPLIDLARRCDELTNSALQEISLPVLVYFSTARLWVGAKKAVELKTKGSKIQDGYAHALTPDHKRSGPSSRSIALGWLKKAYLKTLEERAQGFQQLNYTGPADAVELTALESMLGNSRTGQLLAAVFQAITTCVPDWEHLTWDIENDDLSGIYRRPDAAAERVPLYFLSDGLRTMAGMVAEIAYRCVTLNGHLGADAIRSSHGLVLIDELDMHLHPNWQRRVVADLKRAFPNLQFVVTTHSPFIVQSLDSLELINLDHPTDVQPKELRLEDVATEVMAVDSPLSIESQLAEEQALAYLQRLHVSDHTSGAELGRLEEAVANPGLRAMLRMERLLKEARQ